MRQIGANYNLSPCSTFRASPSTVVTMCIKGGSKLVWFLVAFTLVFYNAAVFVIYFGFDPRAPANAEICFQGGDTYNGTFNGTFANILIGCFFPF